MEYYGHVLTIYGSNDTQIGTVINMLDALQSPYELIENTFFFGTTSIKKSRDFQKELAQTNIVFTFFFLLNPDGSAIKARGIDQDTVDHIEGIFFEDI